MQIPTDWPLSADAIEQIHAAALDVLRDVGMAEPLDELVELATARGCTVDAQGRLRIPPGLVEEAIAETSPLLALHGRAPEHDIRLDESRILYGHPGIAPMVVDLESGAYRESTLADLYDINRLTDALDNLSAGGPYFYANDVEDTAENAVNKVYAMASATTKHVNFDLSEAAHVRPVRDLIDIILEEHRPLEDAYAFQVGACPTLAPLRYEPGQSRVLIEAARHGFPVSAIMAPLSGASAPATLAGALVLAVAESLGQLVQHHLVVPGRPILLGIWPFVTDLRTGAFSGGGGEQALLAAAAAQMLRRYGIPGSVPSGMSDAKVPDAQSGFEKGITTVLAGLNGPQMIGECAGMQGSLMATSFEGLVIDNDMIGAVERVRRGIEVTSESLAVPVIERVIGDGMTTFLFDDHTLEHMRSEYAYPAISDRTNLARWQKDGAQDVRARARERAREILATHHAALLPEHVDARIRERFPIHLPRERMLADATPAREGQR